MTVLGAVTGGFLDPGKSGAVHDAIADDARIERERQTRDRARRAAEAKKLREEEGLRKRSEERRKRRDADLRAEDLP